MNKELSQYIALILENQRIMMQKMETTNSNDELLNIGIKDTQLAISKLTKEKKKNSVSVVKNDDAGYIFEAWNDISGLPNHKRISQHLPAIKKLLKNADINEIISSFINYATILGDPAYIWTKKWTLSEFLTRGFLRFHNEANPFENIMKVGTNGRKFNSKSIISDQEKGEFGDLFTKSS